MNLHPQLRRHWPLAVLGAALACALAWAALAPIKGGSHEQLLELPPGSHAAPVAVPAEIRLTRGVRDVLLLRNLDRVPLVFGPLDIGPGREFRLPFEAEGEHQFACPAVIGGLVRVRVMAAPDPGWERLRWRLANLGQALRWLPLRGPER